MEGFLKHQKNASCVASCVVWSLGLLARGFLFSDTHAPQFLSSCPTASLSAQVYLKASSALVLYAGLCQIFLTLVMLPVVLWF